jgi:hypothetical protein
MCQDNLGEINRLRGVVRRYEEILREIAALVGLDESMDYGELPAYIRGDDGPPTISTWISDHLALAQEKHPGFAISLEHGCRVVRSEMLEWQAAALLAADSDRRRDLAMTEAAHVCVVLLRWLDMMRTTYECQLPAVLPSAAAIS